MKLKQLQENMRRFRTKNLTESNFKNILTEAPATDVMQVTMLNVTTKDLQPYINRLNAFISNAANQFIQTQKKDIVSSGGGAPLKARSEYVKLTAKEIKNADSSRGIEYEIIPSHPGGAGHFRDYPSKFRYTGGNISFKLYTNSTPDTKAGQALINGTLQLTNKFTKKPEGIFNQSAYNEWLGYEPKNYKVLLKSMLFGVFGTYMGKDYTNTGTAMRNMAKHITSNGFVDSWKLVQKSSPTLLGDGKLLNIINGTFPQFVETESANIDQLVDNKFAQFNSALTAQIGQ